jgi:hypothetical protein
MKSTLCPLALALVLILAPGRCGAIPGACCLTDESCVELTAGACAQQGGNYLGDGVPCQPNPCLSGSGACCPYDGFCTVTTFLECGAVPGACVWMAGLTCDPPNPCPQCCPVVCCLQEGACRLVQCGEDCSALGGSPLADVFFCSPNPCVTSGATEANALPDEARLLAGPNPFRDSIVLRFEPERAEPVRIQVFDLLGRVVRTLLDGTASPGGPALGWNGRDDSGRAVPSGLYFLRVSAPSGRLTLPVLRID